MAPLSRRAFLAASALSLSQSALRGATPLKLATFQEEVTPPLGHPCMGGGIAPVKEIVDPLYAHGIILVGSGEPIAIVAVDWCEIRNDAYDRWREAIAVALGTRRERILVSALHQHDAPIADLDAEARLRKVKAAGSICQPEFHERTVLAVAKAAKAALDRLQPVTHLGTGKAVVAEVASNRRYLDAAGAVRYDRMSASKDPKVRGGEVGTIDPELKMLSFWNGETPLAVLSAYATHPMSYYGRGGVTADFVGLARRMSMADLPPKTASIYISGCSGNVTAGKYNDGATTNREALAKRIHAAMQRAWKSTVKSPLERVDFRNATLKLEARSGVAFEQAALEKKLRDGPRPFDQCLAALGLSWRNRVEAGRSIDVPCLDFGSAAYLLLPAEAYVEYQLFAQAQRPKDLIVVAGYGECGPGYIPIERAWKENDQNLSDWCWVNPGSEALMNEAIRKALLTTAK